jgi:hypothetical protein
MTKWAVDVEAVDLPNIYRFTRLFDTLEAANTYYKDMKKFRDEILREYMMRFETASYFVRPVSEPYEVTQ